MSPGAAGRAPGPAPELAHPHRALGSSREQLQTAGVQRRVPDLAWAAGPALADSGELFSSPLRLSLPVAPFRSVLTLRGLGLPPIHLPALSLSCELMLGD